MSDLIAGQARSTIQGTRPALVRKPLRATAAKPLATRAWVSPVSEAFGEKLLYSLLALSAVAGIAYGFLSVLERAQNWSVSMLSRTT